MNEQDKTIDTGYEGRAYSYEQYPFVPEINRAFGEGPKDGFVMTYWDGDIFVTYASWRRASLVLPSYNGGFPIMTFVAMIITLSWAATALWGAFQAAKRLKNPQ